MENIYKKIYELNLEQLKGFKAWLYDGDTYKDERDNIYAIIDESENKELRDLGVCEGVHLYRIESGEIEDEFDLILII